MDKRKKEEIIYTILAVVGVVGGILYLIGVIPYSLPFGCVETVILLVASVISFRRKDKSSGILQLILELLHFQY
jgi:hypothetical protein